MVGVSTTDNEQEPDAEAEAEAGAASGPVVDAIVEAQYLDQFIETYLPIVQEGRLHFDEDGLHAKIVDPANVAMAFTDLSDEAFESYSCGRVTVGVNLERFSEALSVADPGDLVHLVVDMERRVVELTIDHIDQTVRLIDPDAIRKEPEPPDLDLPNEVVLEGDDLDTVATVADMVSDHVTIEGDPDAEEVRFVAEGDVEDSTIHFGHDETLDVSVLESTATLLSLVYVGDLAKPIPGTAEVRIRFGDDFPTIWSWEASDGHQTTEQMLAPRISTQ